MGAQRGRSRRAPIYLDVSVAHTESFTNAAEVWDSSIVRGAFSLPRAKLNVRFATFFDRRMRTPCVLDMLR